MVFFVRADRYLLKIEEKPIFKGDFKEVNAFWNKILKPKLGTGTGGIFKVPSSPLQKHGCPRA